MSVNSAIASKNNNEKITVNGIEYAGTLYATWAEALAATGVDAYVADGLTLERQNTGAKEVVLNNVTISGQEAAAGGAIAGITGKMTIAGGTFSNNNATGTAQAGGGVIFGSSGEINITTTTVDGKVTGALFDSNTSANSGGAIAQRNAGAINIDGATFSNNSTDGNGGAIANIAKGTITVKDSLFVNNSSTSSCNAIYNNSTMVIDGCTFATASDTISNGKSGVVTFKNINFFNADIGSSGTLNVAENGGFVFNNDHAIGVKALTFEGNNSVAFKGSHTVTFATGQSFANVTSVAVDGSEYLLSGTYSIAANAGDLIDVDKINFTAGTAEFITGQQLSYANGTLIITVESSAVAAAICGKNEVVKAGDTYYAGQKYDSWADALAATDVTAYVADGVTLERQVLAAGQTVVLNNVTISNQSANGGGAIHGNTGVLTIAGGEFSNNTATDSGNIGGGAIYRNVTTGVLNVIRDSNGKGTVFAGNHTENSGGAVTLRGGGTMNFDGATFFQNTSAKNGAAIANIPAAGTINIKDTLFYGNDGTNTIYNGGTMVIDGCTFATVTDTLNNKKSLTFKGENILNAKLTGAATVADGASFVFDNDAALDFSGAAFTFDGNNAITFKGSKTVTFAATDSLANVAITVDGADYTAAGSYVIAADAAGITAGNWTFNPAAALAPYLSQNLSYADNTLTLNVVSSAVPAALYTSSGKDAIKLGDTWYSGTACDSWSEALAATGVSKYIADGVELDQQTAAMLTDKDVIFNNVTIKDQTTTTGGGAINDGNRIITIAGGTFVNNSAVGGSNNAYGGGALKLDTGFVITTTLVDGKVTGALFSGNNSDKTGGAIQVNANDLSVDGATFYQNQSNGGNGGAIGDRSGSATDITVSNTTFDRNKTTGSGGAIYSYRSATLNVTDSTFTGNSSARGGGAIYIEKGATISGSKFYNNAAGTEYAGGAIYVDSNASDGVIIRNSVFSGNTAARGTVSALANVEITGSEFSGNTAHISGAALNIVNVVEVSGSEFDKNISGTNGGAVIIAKNDSYQATFADTVFSGNTAVTGKGGAIYNQGILTITTAVVDGETKGVLFSGNTSGSSGAAIMQEDAAAAQTIIDGATFSGNYTGAHGTLCFTSGKATISNTVFDGNIANGSGGAIYSDADVTVRDSQFLTATDTIYVQTSGTLTFGGSITLNSALGGRGTYVISKDTVFTNAVDLSAVNVSVDGSLYSDKAVTIATGVTAIGNYTTGNDNLFLTVENGSLILREANVTGDAATFAGSGSNLMTAGTVGTLFADKAGTADNIATTLQGGKVESNLVGGAYVSAGNIAEVDKVELLIGGTAELADGSRAYAGGYLYGKAGDTEAAAEAQLTVGEVNINLTGGTVGGNLYGGAHARQNGNASVTKVNITVTDGSHSRIYAGGWAEKGAVSSVGTANITISGGTVDYLYGGGANADGTTTVGTTNITISGDAVVNTIFMGGRYGYSWVDNVNLTFAGENKELTRLSGVSSAGMDYAKATVVELATNVTADLIDYVDKFVINEGYTLTAVDEFYLGDRNNETGATEDFTTFDFITDGLDKEWTAVAGISDFTNAKFAVNGSEAQLWDGTAAIEIGGYNLTYDAADKTIKLAQVTA